MKCPNCGLINRESALRCDCGYDFRSAKMKGSYLTGARGTASEISLVEESQVESAQASVEKRPARAWRITLGAILLLIGAVNSANVKPTASQAKALGRLSGLLILVVLAVWLISSGLPRSVGNPELKRTRRRIWYRLAGVGFLVMIAVVVLLVFLSFFTVAVLVTWLYWFGWTWISWLIADKRAVRQLQS